jgi:hypothetical protein
MNRTRFASALAMAALAAILLPSFLHAQITFQRTYGGTNDEWAISVQQTSDGGYVVTGTTRSIGAGDHDVYLVKVDVIGDTLWTRTSGGEGYDQGEAVQQTTDGDYIVAGYTWSFGAGGCDAYLVRFDTNGDTLWTRTFGGDSEDYAFDVQQTTDTGYIIAGCTYSRSAGAYDVYLVKTDAHGDTLWTRTYGGMADDEGLSIQQTTDGGYIVAGFTRSFGFGDRDVYLIKTNDAGETLWTRTIGDSLDNQGKSIRQTTDGGYIVTGYTGSGAGGPDVYLIKTDAHGDTLWTRVFGGTGDDRGYSVWQTTDGGYIIGGAATPSGASAWDVYLIKTDAGGDALWAQTFGGGRIDGGSAVQQTDDSGYVIAGYTTSFGAGEADVWLIKTDADGNVAIAEPKASPTRAPALSLTCEPNPSSGTTRISLAPQASSSRPLTLRIYDAQGRVVRSFSSLLPAPSSLMWDGTDDLGQRLPSGAYFVRLNAGGEHATARLVLQR